LEALFTYYHMSDNKYDVKLHTVIDLVLKDMVEKKINRGTIDECIISSIIRGVGEVPYNSEWYTAIDEFRHNGGNVSNFFGTGYDIETLSEVENIFSERKLDIEVVIRKSLTHLATTHGIAYQQSKNLVRNKIYKVTNPKNVNKKFQTKQK